MRIPSDAQRKQIMQSLVAADRRYPAGRNKPSQHICHFEIEKVGRMQGLNAGIDTSFDLESGTGLKQPLDGSGRIEHDQRASRSSRRMRTVSRSDVTGSR